MAEFDHGSVTNALGMIDQTIYSNVDNGDAVTWSNGEVLRMLVEIRRALVEVPQIDYSIQAATHPDAYTNVEVG